MKLVKKIILASITTLISVGSLTFVSNLTPEKVNAATTTSAKLINNNNRTIPTFDKNGKELKSTLKAGSTVNYYGNPLILNGKTYRNAYAVQAKQINKKTYTSLGDGGYILASATNGMNSKFQYRVVKNTTIVDSNGKKLKTYRGKSANIKATFKSPVLLSFGGNTAYNLPESYLKIGTNKYIRTSYATRLNGKYVIALGKDTYAYNNRGQKIQKLTNHSVLTTDSKLQKANKNSKYFYYTSPNYKNNQTSTFKFTKIKGNDYFKVGTNRYVPASSVISANGMILYTRQSITVKLLTDRTVYNSNYDELKETCKAGTTVKLDQAAIDNSLSDPQLYFRIQGTKHYIYWGDYGEYPERVASYDPDYNEHSSFMFSQFMIPTRHTAPHPASD